MQSGDGRFMIGNYEVVDLGLSNGLLFATCNVGATKETDYGDYYKYGYGSQQYESSNSYYLGNENPLASAADTATQVMGSEWRMPTATELRDLIDKTDYKWVNNFNGSGINGGIFTSKTNPNAYVFFPAAGLYSDGKYYDDRPRYWSSTPDAINTAYFFSFEISGRRDVAEYGTRYLGFSVRGVHAAV